MEKNTENEREKKRLNFDIFKRTLAEYAEKFKEEDRNLAFSLTNAICRQGENDLIILEVSNKIAESEINHCKQKILSFVKQETGFDKIVLQVVCKQQELKTKIYSPADTYKHFKEKRPEIEKLVKAFDCEFEY